MLPAPNFACAITKPRGTAALIKSSAEVWMEMAARPRKTGGLPAFQRSGTRGEPVL